jgi:hypothetical protein
MSTLGGGDEKEASVGGSPKMELDRPACSEKKVIVFL